MSTLFFHLINSIIYIIYDNNFLLESYPAVQTAVTITRIASLVFQALLLAAVAFYWLKSLSGKLQDLTAWFPVSAKDLNGYARVFTILMGSLLSVLPLLSHQIYPSHSRSLPPYLSLVALKAQ